ncbi:endonuclease domain-containing protein, partial [Candidatus Margulisiibacteriota bacterium]
MTIQEDIKKEFARALRKDQTKSEDIVWEALRDRRFMSLKFRRQHVIKGYVVDFYCRSYKLVIEIDGKIHDSQKDYDEFR